MKFLISVLVLVLVNLTVNGQQTSDSVSRRNTIKVDLTSRWLYRNAAMFSYERVVKNNSNQTWCVTAGFQQFPTLVGAVVDTISVDRDSKAIGYKLGGEYRFYLKKENKFSAPRGVYLGPYSSFHHYVNSRSLEVDTNGLTEYADLETDLNILNIGVQLGYQFVLNNRWTIDLTFIGPSVSHYALKTTLDGNHSFDADDVTNVVMQALIDRFPGFKQLIDEAEFTSKGRASKWGYGYRYQLHVGYHFGRKKK